tara:strand:- start:1994 stop:2218 length:225 start_codon:yes stop_codon:yes gene_type:complete
MKKKVKKLAKWFYSNTDKGYTIPKDKFQIDFTNENLYDMIEKLQNQLHVMESQHMELVAYVARMESRLDNQTDQ